MFSTSRSSTVNAMPRYSPRIPMPFLLSTAPHDHRGGGRRVGPAEICAHLDIPYLAAAALAVVESVLTLAIGPDGARIIGIVPQLTGVLDDHVHTVRVALAEMPAAGVVGTAAPQLYCAAADIFTALSLLAEPVILQLQHCREGKSIIGAGDVDVLRSDPGIGPEDLAGVIAGHCGDRPVLVMHVETRLVAAAHHAADQYQRLLAVAGPLGGGHDDRGRIVGLDAAIQEVQRLADDAAVEHVFDGKALLVIGFWVIGGVMAMRHLDHRDLLGLRAVIVHVAHKSRGKILPGALPAVGTVVQHVADNRGG